ncbi:response regulator transcription factor [Sphingomonas sabuli]|uniref:Response regulator transcription factor n=1 Tax=Sphingomonas sabuli TaxID=2764186 RepID=A0A7G9L2B4_9SPHN|nr:response regulator transcription factor [Sphingomonas sabuli]QNM82763.1 response regulator transcription factor [Sphingomonas sabuli]
MARIIIADDDELVVDIVRAALEARGHIVGALPDGVAVQAVLQSKRPDLLILDCNMPEKGGITALREVRAAAGSYDIPVLMLTARTAKSDEWLAYQSGADDFLRKPFDADQLVARAEALLGDSRRLRA